MIAAALTIGLQGHLAEASKLLLAFGESAPILGFPVFAVKAVKILVAAGRIDCVLRLAERFASRDRFTAPDRFRSILFRLPALLRSAQLSAEDRARFQGLLKTDIARIRRKGHRGAEASAMYSLANWYKSQQEFHKALRQYRRAMILDPKYRSRPYIWQEMGGANFMLERYSESVRCYRKALDLGASGEGRALYADALLFAGRFGVALREFTKFLRGNRKQESEWRLKESLAEFVVRRVGIRRQTRRRKAAERLVGNTSEPPSDARSFDRALQLDALSGLVWFNRGVFLAKSGDKSLAAESFGFAGICQPNDLKAWCNSIALALSAGDGGLFCHVLTTAYHYNGEELYGAVRQFALSQAIPAEEFVGMIREVLDVVPPATVPRVTLRQFSTRGGYKEVTVSAAPGEENPSSTARR